MNGWSKIAYETCNILELFSLVYSLKSSLTREMKHSSIKVSVGEI